MNKFIFAVGGLLTGGLVVLCLIQRESALKLREQNLMQQQQLAQLAAENERLSKRLPQASPRSGLQDDQVTELLRLRGQVGGLRDENHLLHQRLLPEAQTTPGQTNETISRPKFRVSYNPTLWNIKASDFQSMTWDLQTDSSGWVQVTVASRPDRKDEETYKKELLDTQRLRGDLAELVGERLEIMGGRKWTVLEFRNASTKPTRTEIHYFLPTNDGYLAAFVIGEEATMPGHREAIEAFLHQIRLANQSAGGDGG